MVNLQSNPSSSTQTTEKRFEVFLNFGGETRDGFANNLYEALRAKSIEAFMDEPGLKKGDEIGPNHLTTIRDSKISVVIFSKEYASSKWRLRDLVEIMECKEKNGQTVIPVFYNVAVSDVRYQRGSFKDGFDQLQRIFYEKLAKDKAAWIDSADPKSRLCPRQSDNCMASFDEREKTFLQEMQNWREALKKASRVKGWDCSVTRPESKLVDEMVKDISEKLMKTYKLSACDFEGVVGSRSHLSSLNHYYVQLRNASLFVVAPYIKLFFFFFNSEKLMKTYKLSACDFEGVVFQKLSGCQAHQRTHNVKASYMDERGKKVICRVLVMDKNCKSSFSTRQSQVEE